MTKQMQPATCSADELRALFLFEKLSDSQLAWLCREGRVELFPPGLVYAEGDPATCFYVLLSGTLVLSRKVGADDVETNRTSAPGVYAGAFTAYLGDRVPQIYQTSMRVTEPSRFFVLEADTFARMMAEWFPMAVHLLEGAFFGVQNAQRLVQQRERLLALGSLSAGLTHELNNPAAAAVRATAALRERVAGMRHKLGIIAAGRYDPATLETLIKQQERAAEQVAKAPALSPIEAADREDAVADWLDGHGIDGGWSLAPVFVQAGLDAGWLDQIAACVDEDTLDGAVRWLNYTIETELLMNEIEDSTTRISSLVGAAKQYSQIDRAPFQVVNVHDLLESTLVMLAGKIGGGEREPHLETRVARLRFHPQVPVVLVHHDPPGDVQPEAGALPHLLGGEERLEDPVPDVGGHAWAGVADLDQGPVTVEGGPHGERAGPAHREHRVVDQIRPDLVQLRGVDGDRWQAAVVVLHHPDAVTDLA